MALSTKDTDDYSDGSTTTSYQNAAKTKAGRYGISQFDADHINLPISLCRDNIQTSYSLPLPDFGVTKRLRRTTRSSAAYLLLLAVLLNCLISPASAVFIKFQNCLSQDYQNGNSLQFAPLYVDAIFNATDPSHNLNVTVWGNVTGSLPPVILPPGSNTSYWDNANNTDGKIVDVDDPSGVNKKTSLFRKVTVLTYQPYQSPVVDFCENLINGTCPLGPVFPANESL